MKTVLISGAGVAGLTLAHWLHHYGFAPTVVEKAAAPRPGGQAVDVRGVALDVADRTGIGSAIRTVRTRMRGMSLLDPDGNEIHRSTEETFSGGRLDNDDIELLREDLTDILYGRVRAGVELIHGDSVTALTERTNGVHVTFERGAPRVFDLVIGADGLHSRVRELVFGEESRFLHHLGTYLAVFGMENFLELTDWQVWLRDGTAGYGIYPVRANTEIRVMLGFESAPLGHDHRDIEQQRRLTADAFAALRWETPRLLKAMAGAPDFYFDSMAHVRMGGWSKGRVALLGDAGYCASPLSGQGTSLALVGAYILAYELGRAAEGPQGGAGRHGAAFARYEGRMRPFVEINQAIALENPGGPASEESVDRAKNAISLDDV